MAIPRDHVLPVASVAPDTICLKVPTSVLESTDLSASQIALFFRAETSIAITLVTSRWSCRLEASIPLMLLLQCCWRRDPVSGRGVCSWMLGDVGLGFVEKGVRDFV